MKKTRLFHIFNCKNKTNRQISAFSPFILIKMLYFTHMWNMERILCLVFFLWTHKDGVFVTKITIFETALNFGHQTALP